MGQVGLVAFPLQFSCQQNPLLKKNHPKFSPSLEGIPHLWTFGPLHQHTGCRYTGCIRLYHVWITESQTCAVNGPSPACTLRFRRCRRWGFHHGTATGHVATDVAPVAPGAPGAPGPPQATEVEPGHGSGQGRTPGHVGHLGHRYRCIQYIFYTCIDFVHILYIFCIIHIVYYCIYCWSPVR